MTTALSRKSKTTSIQQTPQTYTALRTAVRQAIQLGKERATQAVEREKVRTSWEIGGLILEHILLNKDRADYGDKVIEKLSKDLGVGKRELQYMVEFARAYSIVPARAQLSWSHYRSLLAVNEIKMRNHLADEAVENNWSSRELQSEIKKTKTGNKTPKKPETLPAINPGALDVFRTREVNGKTLIDLGFSTYLDKSDTHKKLKFVKDRNFTYRAELEAVVDGDTLWCVVDLGLGVKTRQKLRLAKINAPEVSSKVGQDAKKFLSKKIKKGSQILIATTKSDKFDRYLADVWLDTKNGQEYINQALVVEGYATPVGG